MSSAKRKNSKKVKKQQQQQKTRPKLTKENMRKKYGTKTKRDKQLRKNSKSSTSTTSTASYATIYKDIMKKFKPIHSPFKVTKVKQQKKYLINSKYQIGDMILIDRGREGIIHYIGPVGWDKKNEIWYGIELLGGAIGIHDGKVHRKRYFKTMKKRAIFIKEEKIRRVMKIKDINTPKRLDRQQSLRRNSKSLTKKNLPQKNVKNFTLFFK